MRRIIDATHRCVRRVGSRTTLAVVATDLGVSRATGYRYFPSTAALLIAAAEDGTRRFIERLGVRLRGGDDLSEAIIEGVVHTVTQVADEPYLRLLLDEPTHTLLRSVTSSAAREIAQSVLTEGGWSGGAMADEVFDELIEWALRVVQSFLSDRGDPPRDAEQLRDYLHRWLAPAIRASTGRPGVSTPTA